MASVPTASPKTNTKTEPPEHSPLLPAVQKLLWAVRDTASDHNLELENYKTHLPQKQHRRHSKNRRLDSSPETQPELMEPLLSNFTHSKNCRTNT
ncbi:unnamed protein product [Microthlaspi erraticum]|uniref:Uncharacterized protein n=1 Tax=Microthlaspi erraticum TaxID=1685480 RepID=A0A6D2IWH4_9BRAS|nr:unnamed protein product [Microthlaspi erraticum]